MNARRKFVAIFIILGLIGVFSLSYYILEGFLGQTEKLIVEFKVEDAKEGGLTPRAENILYDFHKIIGMVNFLAQIGFTKGYYPLEKIVSSLPYQGETEMIYQEVYVALGQLGKRDRRAVNLLLSEFHPEADPVRATDVLAGIKLTGNQKNISDCRSKRIII